jgi:S-phase kinase-associated protein 1
MAEKKEDGLGGLDCDDGDDSLVLVPKNGEPKSVKKNYIKGISKLIQTTVETDDTATEIPIPAVEANIMEYIIKYANHHKGVEQPCVEKPLRSKNMVDVCKDKWDADFIDEVKEANLQDLYDLILAANYMDIKSLLHLGCAKVASLIKGQPLEKIKEILAVS